jgi:hypothetical protein
VPANQVFKLRESGINVKQEMPLDKLLHRYAKVFLSLAIKSYHCFSFLRFSSLSVAENQTNPFCTEKQQLDIVQRSGVLPPVPKSIPVKGQPLYYDPWDTNVKEIKRYFNAHEKEKNNQFKAKLYQNALKDIPDVNYYPTTKLKEMQMSRKIQQINNEIAEIASSAAQDLGATEEQEQEEYSQTISPSHFNSYGFIDEFDPKHNRENDDENNNQVEAMIQEDQNYMKIDEDEIQMKQSLSIDTRNSSLSRASKSKNSCHGARSFDNRSTKKINYLEEMEKEYPNWENAEFEVKKALKLAKKGDTTALYDLNIGHYLEEYHIENKLEASSASLVLLPAMYPSPKALSESSSRNGSRQASRQLSR